MDESRWAVVRGCAFFCVRAIFDNLKLQISNLKRKKNDNGVSNQVQRKELQLLFRLGSDAIQFFQELLPLFFVGIAVFCFVI